jgi:hypothetical protein
MFRAGLVLIERKSLKKTTPLAGIPISIFILNPPF